MADEIRYGSERSGSGKLRVYAEFDDQAVRQLGARFAVAILDQVSKNAADLLTTEIVAAHREEILRSVSAQQIIDTILKALVEHVLDGMGKK